MPVNTIGRYFPAAQFWTCVRWSWQGRQDSNLQPLVLETSALPIELHPCEVLRYLVSRCRRCCRQRGQNLFSSSRPGSFFLFFRVLYVRSLQVVHARAITGRFSALATAS